MAAEDATMTEEESRRNRLYEEYRVDLDLMGKENADRVVDFINAKPNERKIRNPYVQRLVNKLRASSFEGSWLDELDDVDKFLDTRNVENSKQQPPIAQEDALGISIQWLTDQKKNKDDMLVRVQQKINEVSQVRNLLHQTYVFN
ncbi:hypothetical protein P8452_09793 [Trifolium repens]|nr:hypothetical protein P8452_09793 [Trifolium repens]